LLFPLFWELPDRVDYGMLEQRYSPADVVEAVPKPMVGNPEKGRICTSHVERQNLTIRRQPCETAHQWTSFDYVQLTT
jgi:hypothetical protein